MTEKRQVKKIIRNEKGTALVSLNVSYPYYTDENEKGEPSKASKRFNAHYEKMCGAISTYAETEQKKKAAALCQNSGFKMFSSSVSCTVAYEDEKYVSVALDITSYSGGNVIRKRIAENWDMTKGLLCTYSDFFGKEGKTALLELLYSDAEKRMEKNVGTFYSDYKKRIRKFLRKNDFLITPSGYAFIFESGALNEKNAPVTLTVPDEFFHREGR